MSSTPALAASSSKPPTLFLIAGLVLLGISAVMMVMGGADPARPFLGWILGLSFWLSILVGMQFLLMIWWLFDAGWAVVVRRQFEHAMAGFPYLALIFLPLVILSLGFSDTRIPWIWMNADALIAGGGTVIEDVLFLHKAPYLNQTFFVIRYILIFATWIGLAYYLRKWSFQMDETGDPANVHNSRKLAALGMFLCALATTLASVDWFKSLNYHWFSTMYGVWFFSACMRAGLSAGVLLLFYQMTRPEGLKGIVKPAHFYFLACLMFAFTVFWAYISFSQYFLIYSANIPEEVFWFNIREINKDGSKNSWWWVSMALIFLHFLLPFLYLLWNKNKYGVKLKFIAIWILAFHLLDLYWNIIPQKLAANGADYTVRQFSIHPADITVFLGVGAICVWAYLKSAAQYRPIPIRDPRIKESINCHV